MSTQLFRGIPLLILSVFLCVGPARAQQNSGAVSSLEKLSFRESLELAYKQNPLMVEGKKTLIIPKLSLRSEDLKKIAM